MPGDNSRVTILISSRVTEGFLNKHIKALLGKPYKTLREGRHGRPSEIARLLYPFLDGQLASKDEYHCKLTLLAERFGLRADPRKSYRQKQFATAVAALDGKAIQGERCMLRVRLELASDGKDYVLVACRQDSPDRPARI